ncbi:MAG TPA: anthranilate phosphoribosyltransferase [Nitrososphaeraceae archaeon]
MNFQDFEFRPFIKKLMLREDLTEEDIETSVDLISKGQLSVASIAAFLVALAMKKETPNEIQCLVRSVRKRSVRLTPKHNSPIVDICGTGGDFINTPNISTAAAVVASGSGVCVAKHGNRSMSGLCGSADFLEHIGFDLGSPLSTILSSIEKIGIGFIYAPMFHPSMGTVAAARKLIGARTVFNIIGPLSNPCTNLAGQVIGVTDPLLFEKISTASLNLGLRNVMVVHAHENIDELSNTGPNDISLKDGKQLKRIQLDPKDVNIKSASIDAIKMKTKKQSIKTTLECIYGHAERELLGIVELNAAAVLVVADKVRDIGDGIDLARKSIIEGKARSKLYQLIDRCGQARRLEEVENELGIRQQL